ncbi:MAG TPA: hypothetical protein VK674_03470 [Candidatus Limnocylindria bacterium]|nr:hypothetical protein [Candidatus Limnocylindria bacterium]
MTMEVPGPPAGPAEVVQFDLSKLPGTGDYEGVKLFAAAWNRAEEGADVPVVEGQPGVSTEVPVAEATDDGLRINVPRQT